MGGLDITLSFNIVLTVAFLYTLALFAVAYFADKRSASKGAGWLRSPLTYTLSLSVYCTAWTFYGAVGTAVRSGLEYLAIYLGPTLVFLGWWWLLRKLVRIGRAERITSIADLISSRYGKSNTLAVIVTVLAVVGTTPYIALQLQSVSLSMAVFAMPDAPAGDIPASLDTITLWLAMGLALFTILFGTRNVDANGRHCGVVMAIAVEAVIKLLALLAVGGFVVWGAGDGVQDILQRIAASPMAHWQPDASRWSAMVLLSAAAVICLPRMFQVMVVENVDEDHLRIAAWAFPGYLLAISLFVLPIAVMGLEVLPTGANPDLFVLSLPLALGRDDLALLAFLGGFSSATSMVIVACIAVSTMVSNHIVMPVWLKSREGGATMSGDVRDVVLMSRRLSIVFTLALGYGYYRITGGSTALSAIGLVSFAGVAQVLPALLGGIFWRGATRRGAIGGLVSGFVIWAYTLFLPTLGVFGETTLTAGPGAALSDGAGGWHWLHALAPHALFGMSGMTPLVHSLFWSLSLNLLVFLTLSLITFPTPRERLQAANFVNIFQRTEGAIPADVGRADAGDLLVMAQRLLGAQDAQFLFRSAASAQGKQDGLPEPTPEFVDRLERELAGSVGAATAHAMMSQINGQLSVTVEDLLAVANETAQVLEYSSRLEEQSHQLERTARELREANEKLTALSKQKDAFLSQVSHELRTPMTSIRSFSEFLRDETLPAAQRLRYSGIIHEESLRLTRLLDDLLDLSVLERGKIALSQQRVDLSDLLDRAVLSAGSMLPGSQKEPHPKRELCILRDQAREQIVMVTDGDRLGQVFINLISNAQKYCRAERPQLKIDVMQTSQGIQIDFIDNGLGIAAGDRAVIFEKFARLSDEDASGSLGLGLAISREIMQRLGGGLHYLSGATGGAAFRVSLPLAVLDRSGDQSGR